MTVEEAGDRYLTYVCVSNAANDKYNAVVDKFEASFTSSSAPHPKTVKAAERGAKAYATTAQALADAGYVWPEAVRKDITTVANGIYEQAAWFTSIVEADTWDDVYQLRGTGKVTQAATAARLALGLPPREGCPKEYQD